MATAFLSGLNRARYGVLLNELHNAFRMGRDEYPKTLTAVYDLAINWEGDTKGTGVTPNDGVAFTTESGRGGRTHHRRDEVDANGQASDMPHLWQESLCKKVPVQGRKRAIKEDR